MTHSQITSKGSATLADIERTLSESEKWIQRIENAIDNLGCGWDKIAIEIPYRMTHETRETLAEHFIPANNWNPQIKQFGVFQFTLR